MKRGKSPHKIWTKHLGSFLLAAVLLLILTSSGRAQANTQASLSAPQTERFPRITAYLDIRDDAGDFVTGLRTQDISVFENEQLLPVTEMEELNPGVQMVAAVNPGRPFAIRNSQGTSRYDFVVEALTTWVKTRPDDSQDDLSLITTTGAEGTHLASPDEWLATLTAYNPELRTATPTLEVLSRALDVAGDQTPRPGMGRAVLFITPPLERTNATSLQSLAARANQAGIRVFVWMISSANNFDLPVADDLRNLVVQTNGGFFAFSTAETFPDIEAYLTPLRHVYRLSYNSQINSSGTHSLAVILNKGELQVSTPSQSFDLVVSPPNPVFVSPPAEITRVVIPDQTNEQDKLTPQRQPLELLIEFPDGYERPLERVILYVDGVAVNEKTTPPFDRFMWDLSQFISIGRHILRVEAIDSLGLIGSSIETPVQIKIDQPSQDTLSVISRNGTTVAGVIIVMAGAVLLFILIIGGRIRPRPLTTVNPRRPSSQSLATRPATSRIPTQPALTRQPGWRSNLGGRSGSQQEKPLAYLSRLANGDQGPHANLSIPITATEVTLGSDPARASLVLEDPSVERLHAKMRRNSDGTFHLKDERSIAGTWLNYAPLSQEWTRIETGDLIHIGRLGFRFQTERKMSKRRPKITYE